VAEPPARDTGSAQSASRVRFFSSRSATGSVVVS
jgi:hypothetical protein